MQFQFTTLTTVIAGLLATTSAAPTEKRQNSCSHDGLIDGFSVSFPFVKGGDFTLSTDRACSIPLSGDSDQTFEFSVNGHQYGPFSVVGDLSQSWTEAVPDDVVVGQEVEVVVELVYYLGAGASPLTTATLSTQVPAVSTAFQTTTVTVSSNIPGSQ